MTTHIQHKIRHVVRVINTLGEKLFKRNGHSRRKGFVQYRYLFFQQEQVVVK